MVAKWVFRYANGTIGFGLIFYPSDLMGLQIFIDSDKVEDPDNRRSTTGSCLYISPNLISWLSKKQTIVSQSSAEVEYHAIAHSTVEL